MALSGPQLPCLPCLALPCLASSRAIFPIRVSIHIPPPSPEVGDAGNISIKTTPRSAQSQRQPAAIDRSLAELFFFLSTAATAAVGLASCLTPAAAASHAGHAAAAAAAIRGAAVGTLEMSSSGGGQQQHGEARARLRWTRQLHDSFVLAVAQLGGANKATPKSVLRAMAVPGLTLYHLKSHLQKYRLAVSRGPGGNVVERSSSSSSESQPDQYGEETVAAFAAEDDRAGAEARPCDSSRTVARLQREMERKLQEQIEVQRHLQLRMEAQGRYLQSVLRRAQEVLADHSVGAELSELVSVVETAGCLSSSTCSLSPPPPPRRHGADSCVTSSSSSSSEAESQAADGLRKRDCTVEQPVPVPLGRRSTLMQRSQEEEEEAGAAEAEDGSSSEIDLNRW